jgi:hypothetical protein
MFWDGAMSPKALAMKAVSPSASSMQFRDLVRRGLLDGLGEFSAYQLTPEARSLRRDEAFDIAAFAASLSRAGANNKG